MKTIFIKDDRIGDIQEYLSNEITKLMKKGKIKGSYSSEMSWRKVDIKEFPGYECQYGWEVTDHEDDWKIDDLDNFVITIKKDKNLDNYYFAICEQIFTENVVASLMGCGKTVEGALVDLLKTLKTGRKTLCVRGKAIEGRVAEAIYEKRKYTAKEVDKKIRGGKINKDNHYGYLKSHEETIKADME